MDRSTSAVSRRDFLSLLAASAAGAGLAGRAGAAQDAAAPAAGQAGSGAVSAARPPNFIVIFTDDQGYQDVGCFGSPNIKTPNLDQMAAEGMKFTSFYSAAPVCTPSRAALLTGCYPMRVSLPRVLFPGSNVGISDQETTIAQLLKSRGYATACIGKWHLGHLKPFWPTRHGFDMYLGIPYSNDMSIDPRSAELAETCVFREGLTAQDAKTKGVRNKVPLFDGEKVVEYPVDQSALTRRYTERACGFIRQNKDKPFFLYLPHTMPHTPLAAGEAFKGKSARGVYGDVIEEIDWSVGQILKTVDELKLDERTLVIFTSDNGPWLTQGQHGGSALPLRNGKGTTWEGGMREPCIMRWKGRIPAGKVCNELAGTIDVAPTLAGLAGTALPAGRVIDGKDILPLMTAQEGAKTPHEFYFYWNAETLQAVRSGQWKLHAARGGQAGKKEGKAGKDGKEQKKAGDQPAEFPALYDLEADIGEKVNLYDKHPDVVERLTKAVEAARAEMQANKRPCGKVDR